MKKLDGKIAIATGASKGIRASIAKHLAAVVGKEAADRVVDEIINPDRKAIAVQADVTKKAEVDAVTESLAKELGSGQICVNSS
ncbi:MAG: SDR family NAD(P)-dependent oxidoreductase [Nostoc sp.]|uniref:SDR family NAD(P)-dependent oxidoreductase n=1 Tax=Nostoc sp. TaxID=1180 RepID=UPI002FF54661